jgi:hypothetical protein
MIENLIVLECSVFSPPSPVARDGEGRYLFKPLFCLL